MCVLDTFSILRLVFLHHQVDDTERSLNMLEGARSCEVLHLTQQVVTLRIGTISISEPRHRLAYSFQKVVVIFAPSYIYIVGVRMLLQLTTIVQNVDSLWKRPAFVVK